MGREARDVNGGCIVTSAVGTERTPRGTSAESALRGEADVGRRGTPGPFMTRYGHAPFVSALGPRKDHPIVTLRVCFHALQLTQRIERANRDQFEAHEVGLSQR